jgi:hypothetical protein
MAMNWARVRVRSRCLGPRASTAMYGREIRVSRRVESSFFACSAASPQPLHGLRIAAEVNPRFLFELLDEPVHDPAVEVIAAKLSVAIRSDDLENALADLEDGDVEGPRRRGRRRGFFVRLLCRGHRPRPQRWAR